MTEARKAAVTVLIAFLVLIGCLALEQMEIHDSTLRHSLMQLTAILGAVVVVILMMRGAIVTAMSHVKVTAPQLYSSIRNLGVVIALGLLSIAGCAFTLFVALGSSRHGLDYGPFGLAAVFAGIVAFCCRYIWKDWGAWRTYRHLRADQSKT